MTSSFELTSAIELPPPRLAQIFAASFEGYFVPVSADVGAFATRVRSEHVDLAASLVAFEGGEPVGLVLLAGRGATARIAAMGVVPSARGRQLGRVLLDAAFAQARARGHVRMILEVIEQNAPARALYERNGFAVKRRLVGFCAPALASEGVTPPPVDELVERPLEELVRTYLAEADPALPWQLAPATIAATIPPSRAFSIDQALALVEVLPASVVLRALVVPRHLRRRGHATRILHALRARFADRALRVLPLVPEDLVGTIPERVGAVLDELAQLELEREL